jgi:Zinc carboxypeptidase
VTESGLPSGRTTYRHLADYELELKQLSMQYPSLVKPLRLNHKSVLGRDVEGIEIAVNPANVDDGKPIFLNMGVHHAREWPSSEHAMEWGYDLLINYGVSDRTTRLVQATRNIVIPVVNVDGFNISREATALGDFSLFDYEMKRKNCSISVATPPKYRHGTCDKNQAGRLRGTDPNRNYGGLWGGSGASVFWGSDTFRGDAPFSEPEVQNIRELQSTRDITNLITNHTFSNLVLRPPGVADYGFPLEEPLYKALGADLASHNGYSNIPGFGLYDTTGATEDWTFWTAGSLGFTFEIGPNEFHPPYETGVVAEYLGLEPAAGAGAGGNREAYYRMLEATADPTYHATIRGSAPAGSRLTIAKEFLTATSPIWNNDFGTSIGDPLTFEDELRYTMKTSGPRFEWAINPSTRPAVAGRHGRDPVAPPQAPIALDNPAGIPAENTGDPLTGPHEDVPFTVDGLPDVDNGKMTVHIEWTDPNVDWDLYVVGPGGAIVAQSAAFGDNTEDATLFDPPPGTYHAIIVNYDQIATNTADWDDWKNGSVTFASPTPTTFGEKESWTLTCTAPDGSGRPVAVTVDRGEVKELGDVCRGPKS